MLTTAILATLSGCSRAEGSEGDDQAVLSAIMENRCNYAASHSQGVRDLLSSESSPIDETQFPHEFDRDAVTSLRLRNEAPTSLPKIKLCEQYHLASQNDIKEGVAREAVTGSKDWWARFHKAFPDTHGIFYLSQPGYSKNGDLALVRVSVACGRLCGSAFYWVLRKIDTKWVIETPAVPAGES